MKKAQLRGSNRIKEGEMRRIIDETTRNRRSRKALESLESDNFQDDPHADLVMSKKVPKFEDSLEQRSTRHKKKERTAEYYQSKYGKSFPQLIEEDRIDAETNNRPSYLDVSCDNTNLPQRHFCSVCGFCANYCCIVCGIRYCSIRCKDTHEDTRCSRFAG